MTDFKRQLKPTMYEAGRWRFKLLKSGEWEVRYAGWRQGVAETLDSAIGWAKLHWRQVERETP